MTQIFQAIEAYELFLYTLKDNFPIVSHSNVSLVRKGATIARISGEIHFSQNYRLIIRERLLFHCTPIFIDWYGYELWLGEEIIFRYDCQPHPNEAALESTFPHHKHIQPNINRNRTPAPYMSFSEPNIPELIKEVGALIKNMSLDKTAPTN